MIAHVCKNLDRPDLPFVFSQSAENGPASLKYPFWEEVAKGKAEIANTVPHTATVSTDGLTRKSDGIHYITIPRAPSSSDGASLTCGRTSSTIRLPTRKENHPDAKREKSSNGLLGDAAAHFPCSLVELAGPWLLTFFNRKHAQTPHPALRCVVPRRRRVAMAAVRIEGAVQKTPRPAAAMQGSTSGYCPRGPVGLAPRPREMWAAVSGVTCSSFERLSTSCWGGSAGSNLPRE